MAEKDHFSGRGDCKIHTSRSHAKCSNAAKSCDHQENCKEGWKWGVEWNAHHVLCISSVNRYMDLKAYKDHRDFIRACYEKTPWCINQAANLIALPNKVVYVAKSHEPHLNLPCHGWDHPHYTDEITMQMHLKVWQELKEKKDGGNPCELAKDVVAKQLENLSQAFQKVLATRGRRKVGKERGTDAAWVESQKQPPTSRADKWWYPFSMAKDELAETRQPAAFGNPEWSSAEERLKRRLEKMETRNADIKTLG